VIDTVFVCDVQTFNRYGTVVVFELLKQTISGLLYMCDCVDVRWLLNGKSRCDADATVCAVDIVFYA
jgi:hypothetical protein